jgi:hypothetical protein
MDPYARADAFVRTTLSLADAALRVSYVVDVARTWDVETLARALDIICERAEQAEAASREALLAVIDALNTEELSETVQRLREQAVGDALLALERVVRCPFRAARGTDSARPEVLVDGKQGRALTLGERKSLARRPDRDTMERLLADPHPDVIRPLLHNSRITEDDVVRLAAKRPGRGEVLAEIARCTKWAHRPRVRMAVVMNPATPPEIAARIAGLLLRPELDLVVRSPGVPAGIRAVCLEHLQRRPPAPSHDRGAVH